MFGTMRPIPLSFTWMSYCNPLIFEIDFVRDEKCIGFVIKIYIYIRLSAVQKMYWFSNALCSFLRCKYYVPTFFRVKEIFLKVPCSSIDRLKIRRTCVTTLKFQLQNSFWNFLWFFYWFSEKFMEINFNFR